MKFKNIIAFYIIIVISIIAFWSFGIKEYGLATGQIETLLVLFSAIWYNNKNKKEQ